MGYLLLIMKCLFLKKRNPIMQIVINIGINITCCIVKEFETNLKEQEFTADGLSIKYLNKILK